MSTVGVGLPIRLKSVPWRALEGGANAVVPSLERMLAGEPAERVLDQLLRANREWGADQRRAAAEVLFGVGLWRRRLAHHLGIPDWRAAEPTHLLFSLLTLAGVPGSDAARLAGLPVSPSINPAPPADFAIRHSLPDWLAEVLFQEGETDADALAASLNVPGPIGFRVNLLKTDRDALRERLLREGVPTRPGTYAPTCLVVEGDRPNVLGLASFREGLFEVQDEGSQLLGALVEAHTGESILDLCAGAGGKTLQLAAAVGKGGTVHAYDVDRSKLERLRQRAARAGVANLAIHLGRIPDELKVDRVLVDAPCSELGALRRGPDLRFRMEPVSFQQLPAFQLELLETALRHLRPGGRLVYATCTFRREENEEVAFQLEARHPELGRLTPGWLDPSLAQQGFFRSFPHRHGTDGFFAAVYELLRPPSRG